MEDMKKLRKKAAQRKRRIMMNSDGGDTYSSKPDEPRTAENFLRKRTSPLAGSQVDTICDCTAGSFYRCRGGEEGELNMGGGPVGEDWAAELIKAGRDGLELKIDFGHEHGMEVFRSFRMNDTHDSKFGNFFGKWKKDRPECLMGKKGADDPSPWGPFPYGGKRWSGLNYGLAEVREKVFRVVREVCTNYDVDGIEMDFYRHPHYFRPQMTGDPVTREHCDIMTGFVERVRKMTEEVALKRGRPLLVSVRVPDSVGYSKGVGLDVVRWMEGDLFDILIGGGYLHHEPWENLVALGKRYDVPVYACISGSRVKSSSFLKLKKAEKPEWLSSPHPLYRPIWRGEAMNAWKAGVSGIHTFNLHDPTDSLFREMGSPETLEGLEAVYEFHAGSPAAFEMWLKGGSEFVKRPEGE